jgi:hypothetical protein
LERAGVADLLAMGLWLVGGEAEASGIEVFFHEPSK